MPILTERESLAKPKSIRNDACNLSRYRVVDGTLMRMIVNLFLAGATTLTRLESRKEDSPQTSQRENLLAIDERDRRGRHVAFHT